MQTPRFVPAAELCRDFYAEVLAPALGGIPHAAGLLGAGSEVLGLDTARSTDHDWGPRTSLFVSPERVPAVRALVASALPKCYRGWPLRISYDELPPEHRVTVDAWSHWLRGELGVDPTMPLSSVDWLLIPTQRLLGVVAGPVFADPDQQLSDTRRRLHWYPDAVWWWVMACQWQRVAQEEPFVQRTAEVGDQLGSAVVTARLVRDAMRLALLMARRYPPYSKWLGSAFSRMEHSDRLDRHLAAALTAGDLPTREAALASAYEALARRHAGLPGATALDPGVRRFHDRPALVLAADRFVVDCLERVDDPYLRALPLIGSIDQWADSTDLLMRPTLIAHARRLYSSPALGADDP